jgi:ATP synthase F0 subunit b
VRLLAASDFGSSFYEEIAGLVLFLAFAIYKFPGPLLKRAMDSRQQAIGAQLAAGEQARAQAAVLLDARRAALETARIEAARLVENAGASAERLTAEGERRAAEEYDRLVAKAAADIELERGRLRDEVVTELGDLVVAGARQVVEAELNGERQHRLIGETITAAETEVA